MIQQNWNAYHRARRRIYGAYTRVMNKPHSNIKYEDRARLKFTLAMDDIRQRFLERS